MDRLRFRPTFWASVVALPVLGVLVALGTWQVERLEWKNELIATRAARVAAAPVTVSDVLRDGVAAREYRPITVEGTLRNDVAMRLINRTRDGAPGGHVIAPLVLADGGGTVMVDRGWMPVDALRNFRPGAAEPARIDGFVRDYTVRGAFVPDNEPDRNNWFFLDEAAMMTASGLSGPVGFYVQAGPASGAPGTYPAGSVPDVNLRNSHLEYAVTWYGLALVLIVIFVVFHLRRSEA
jgi:surfeit locus 1 family protein